MAGVASTGRTGIGVLLKVGDGGSPQVFATVGNVLKLAGGGKTLGTVDATHLNSPNFYEEVLPTLKKGEPWTFDIQWDPTDPTQDGFTGLALKLENRTLTTFQIDPSAIGLSQGFEADCYVTAIGNVSIDPTGIMSQSCTLTPSGAPRAKTFP